VREKSSSGGRPHEGRLPDAAVGVDIGGTYIAGVVISSKSAPSNDHRSGCAVRE
jgi:hypothetical protein